MTQSLKCYYSTLCQNFCLVLSSWFGKKVLLILVSMCMLISAYAAIPIPANQRDTIIDLKAVSQDTDDQAFVQWSAADQADISSYAIEKATDGVNYIKVGNIPATGNNTSLITYNWMDTNTVSGSTCYRILAIGNTGVVYSKEVEVAYGNTDNGGIPDITVIPNPITGETMRLQMINIPDGVYAALLVNAAGQVVWLKDIDHTVGNTFETIGLDSHMQAGPYYMTITGHNNYRFILKVYYVR
jgi:hypothetical protein